MKPTRRSPRHKAKRYIQPTPRDQAVLDVLERLAETVRYGGNPEHKRNPGDFNLSPPSQPRQGKSLCDEVGIFSCKEALRLLKEGIRRGLVSIQERDGWPQNVWAVANNGRPLEAMLENPSQGVYHGYPMQSDEPFADEVLKRWNAGND